MDEGVVRIIALDEEHETDPDMPTRPQSVRPALRERPIWGVWEQVTDDGADWHYAPTEHTGLTVAEAQALMG